MAGSWMCRDGLRQWPGSSITAAGNFIELVSSNAFRKNATVLGNPPVNSFECDQADSQWSFATSVEEKFGRCPSGLGLSNLRFRLHQCPPLLEAAGNTWGRYASAFA